MAEGNFVNPAELVVDDDGSYAGYAAIARKLSALHPDRLRPFSRQLVQKWYYNRGYNGFPDAHRVRVENGKVKKWFSMPDVEQWHQDYQSRQAVRSNRAPIETIPLFELDKSGRPTY